MMAERYQVCPNCIMDTTEPNITFDDKGACDYCHSFYQNILPDWYPDEHGARIQGRTIEKIKKDGIGMITIA